VAIGRCPIDLSTKNFRKCPRRLSGQKTSIADSRGSDPVSAEHLVVDRRPETVRGGDPFLAPHPAGLPRVAPRSKLGQAQPANPWQTSEGSVAACRVHGGAVEPELHTNFQGTEEPVLPRRRGWADAESRLGRRMDVEPERLRGGRRDDRRCRGGRQFRPREQSAPCGEGRRP
jgi:hypothetical protein